MRPLTALRLGAVLAFCLGSFTVIASLIFLIGTGLIGDFAHPFWQWWLYLFMMSENPTVRYWLVASAIPAAVLPAGGRSDGRDPRPARLWQDPAPGCIRRPSQWPDRSAARPTTMATPAG